MFVDEAKCRDEILDLDKTVSYQSLLQARKWKYTVSGQLVSDSKNVCRVFTAATEEYIRKNL
jgi:hypothetical protein